MVWWASAREADGEATLRPSLLGKERFHFFDRSRRPHPNVARWTSHGPATVMVGTTMSAAAVT
jgi:hypothetical protein